MAPRRNRGSAQSKEDAVVSTPSATARVDSLPHASSGDWMVSCKWDQTSVAVSVSDRHSGSKAKAAKATGKSKAAASSVEDIAAEPLALFGSRAGGGNGIEWADSGLLMFTGGPVTAVDWLPTATTKGQLLAVVTNAADTTLTPLHGRTTEAGPAVQLWHLTEHTDDDTQGVATAEMVMGIVCRGVPKDVKWCPSAMDECANASSPDDARKQAAEDVLSVSNSALPSFGLLAIAMGDGSVHVVAVPDPTAVRAAAADGRVRTEGLEAERSGSGTEGENAAPTAVGVRLEPRFVGVLPSDLQTPPAPNKANIWELAWHPLAPHHQLAASFTDGLVAVWELGWLTTHNGGTATQKKAPHVILKQPAPLDVPNTIAWGPVYPGCYDQLLTISDYWSGHVGLYDLNEPFAPLCQTHLNHGTPLLRWSEALSSFYGSTDDGELVYIVMDEKGLHDLADKGELHAGRFKLNSEYIVPSFHFAPNTHMLAYCGESGEAAVYWFNPKHVGLAGKSPAHLAVSSWTFDEEARTLRITPGSRDGTRGGTLFCGKEQPKRLSKKEMTSAEGPLRTFAPRRQRLRVCRWGPASRRDAEANWLVHGGGGGVLYLQLFEHDHIRQLSR